MLKVAITGNIASGKSQVEEFLTKEGFIVYDTDNTAHDILNSITEFYGYDVFTEGKIDRVKLGKLVFSNSDIRKKLEEIIHPKVKQKILELFEKHKNEKLIFFSVPLLYETGFNKLFDKVILITIDEQIQLQRLMARNNLTKEDALKRINSQIPQEEKIKKADFIIKNNSSKEELFIEIKNVLTKLNNTSF